MAAGRRAAQPFDAGYKHQRRRLSQGPGNQASPRYCVARTVDPVRARNLVLPLTAGSVTASEWLPRRNRVKSRRRCHAMLVAPIAVHDVDGSVGDTERSVVAQEGDLLAVR